MLDLLFEIGKLGSKLGRAWMIPGLQPLKDREPFEDPKRYRRLVGKLNYLIVTYMSRRSLFSKHCGFPCMPIYIEFYCID